MGSRRVSLSVSAVTMLTLLSAVSLVTSSDDETAGVLAADHPLSEYRGERNLMERDTVEAQTDPTKISWTHSSLHTCSTQFLAEKLMVDKGGAAVSNAVLMARMNSQMEGNLAFAFRPVDESHPEVNLRLKLPESLPDDFEENLRDQAQNIVNDYVVNEFKAAMQSSAREDGEPFDFFEKAFVKYVPRDTFCPVACHQSNCRSRDGSVNADGVDEVFQRCAEVVCPDIFDKVLHFYKELDNTINEAIKTTRNDPSKMDIEEERINKQLERITTIQHQMSVGFDHISLRSKNSNPEYEPENFKGRDAEPTALEELECSIPHMEYLIGDFFVHRKKSGLPIEVNRIHAEISRRENFFCETLCDQSMNCRERAMLSDCKSGCLQRMLMIMNMEKVRPDMMELVESWKNIVANNNIVGKSVVVEYQPDLPSEGDVNVRDLASLKAENEERPDVERRCSPVHLVHSVLFELIGYWESGVGLKTTKAEEMCTEVCQVQLGCDVTYRLAEDVFFDPASNKMHAGVSDFLECKRGCLARTMLMTGESVNLFSISWDFLPPRQIILPDKEVSFAQKFADGVSALRGWLTRGKNVS